MRDSELNTATLPATLREMMRRINDLATRPFGVRSIGPGDGSLTITDASGNDITSMSGDDGWTALVDGAKTDVPGLLTNLKTDMAKKAWTTYVDSRFSDQAATLAKKAWTTYVDYVDQKRLAGDTAIKAEVGKRATKSELNQVKGQLLTRIQSLEAKVNGSSGGTIGDVVNDGGGSIGDLPPTGPSPSDPNPY